MAQIANIVFNITYPIVKCNELSKVTQILKQIINNYINSANLPCFNSGNCYTRVTGDQCDDGMIRSSNLVTNIQIEITILPSGSSLYSNGMFQMAYGTNYKLS